MEKLIMSIDRIKYKKGLNHPDNLDCVVTHMEPDILEWEAKWVIGGTT